MQGSRFRAKWILGAVMIICTLLGTPAAASARPPECDRVDTPCADGPKAARGTVDVAAGQTLGVRPRPKPDAQQLRQLEGRAQGGLVRPTVGDPVSGTFGTPRLWDKSRGAAMSRTRTSAPAPTGAWRPSATAAPATRSPRASRWSTARAGRA